MTSHSIPEPGMPICDISFHGNWTPLNTIFFSQCIQESDEGSCYTELKLRWKRKRYTNKNGKKSRKYRVYECVSSSESEVQVSDEFNSTDSNEISMRSISSDNSEISESDENGSLDKRNVKSRSIADEPSINKSYKCDDLQYEEGVKCKRIKMLDSGSCAEPKIPNSAAEGTRNIKDSISDEPDINSSDEYDDSRSERNVKSRRFADEPSVNKSDKYDGFHYKERVNYKRIKIFDSDSSSEPEIPNSAAEEKNIHNQSVEKKHTNYKCESSDEWETNSSDEHSSSSTSSDYPSSDSSDPDYGVTKKKKKKKNKNVLKENVAKRKPKVVTEKKKTQKKKNVSKENVENRKPKTLQSEYEKMEQENRDEEIVLLKTPQSEYEKMVQKNRDEKVALMKSLKLMEAKDDFKEAVETLMPKESETNERNVLENSDNNIQLFSEDSNDLLVEVDKTTKTKANEVVKKLKVDKTTKNKANKEVEKVLRKSVRQKSVKKKEMFFCYGSLYNELPSSLSFEETLRNGDVYHDFFSEISSSECKTQLFKSDYVSRLEKMTFQESQVISSSLISSIALHESKEKIILCTGNENGQIIFQCVNSDSNCCVFQPHRQRINNLKFNPYSPNMLICSSADGTMHHGDFEKKIFNLMFKADSCNHFDFLCPSTYLVAHKTGYVSIVDDRTHSKTFEKRHKCNEGTVKTVSLHPVNKNYFISAHKRGSVKLWDLRKLQTEPVFDVCCDGDSLISSFFSPVAGNSVLVTMSDTICLLDSSSLYEEFKLKKSIKQKNIACGSVAFQATWLPSTDAAFLIASPLSPRIEIFDDKLYNFFNFTNEHFKYITFNAFHPSLPFLACAYRKTIHIFSENYVSCI